MMDVPDSHINRLSLDEIKTRPNVVHGTSSRIGGLEVANDKDIRSPFLAQSTRSQLLNCDASVGPPRWWHSFC